VGGGTPDAGDARFEAAAFVSLLEQLPGVDLAQAVYLGRGMQVTAYRAGAWVIRVPHHDAARGKIVRQTQVYEVLVNVDGKKQEIKVLASGQVKGGDEDEHDEGCADEDGEEEEGD